MAVSKKSEKESTEIAKVEFTNDELLNVSNFEDAMRLVLEKTGDVLMADQVIGNGFALLDDKTKLVGVPLIILEWKTINGTFGEFVNMLLMTKNNEKFIVSDGSGIPAQLQQVTERTGRSAGLGVKNGLTKSEYIFCEDTRSSKCQSEGEGHKHIPASSFYLDLSA